MSWLSDLLYNAATGNLTDDQKAAILRQTDVDLRVASIGNTSLYERAAAQARNEIGAVFAQAEAESGVANQWQKYAIALVVVFIAYMLINLGLRVAGR